VWESTVEGRVLHFRLAGINNQNFIMRDDETGTWWQQVTGKAVHGPLQGRQLKPVFHDELSFAIWKRERPEGRVLKPDEKITALADGYEAADWEQRVGRMRVVQGTDVDKRLAPRTLVVGVTVNGKSVAYPFTALQKQSPIIDVVGSVPILVVLGEDNRSVRAFERMVDGRRLEFFQKIENNGFVSRSGPFQLVDAETHSFWNFEGKAVSGPLAGRELKKVFVLEDYWFDWRIYHPDTSIYEIGPR
jgi:uncharacterized protein DUF3179